MKRYVALGDSFAASRTGWPESVARSLGQISPCLEYKNLARAGASSADVITHQLPAANALGPDVVTLACGIDELLAGESPLDVAVLRSRLQLLSREMREALPRTSVVLTTYPNFTDALQLPVESRLQFRCALRQLNRAIRCAALASRLGCVDLALYPAIARQSSWPASSDGDGEEVIADAVVRAVLRQHLRPSAC
jgi:hypothetical protein